MFSCFKILRKSKTATKQGIGNPKDHEAKQEVKLAVPPHSPASEGSRDKSPGKSAGGSDRRSRNLWQEAFAKLGDAQRDWLSKIEQSQGPIVVERVADETKKRYRESHKEGRKTSEDKDKNDINLRAAAEKILSSVLRSKKLIDAGVAFDPTGHAASAWTIISLGLQIVQNDIDRLQALLEASGTLADTLARCAAIEACHRGRNLPDSDHLEDTIVEVYVSILEFSAEMVRQNKMKIFRRVLTSINSLAGPPLQDLKIKLSAKEEDLRKWSQIIENEYHKQEVEQIHQTTTSILDEIDQMMQLLLGREELDILEWLSEYDFSASHRYALLQQEPRTGEWIFDNPHYKGWSNSDCSLLWLYGNSGSGKTVLWYERLDQSVRDVSADWYDSTSSKIIDDLQDLCAKDASYALAYWYFSDSSPNSLDLDNLLCSIIRQLCACTQTLPVKIRELWKVYHTGGRPGRASVEEALDVLIVGLAAANKTAFIVLDALDECPLLIEKISSGVQQISEREHALLWLRRFTAKHGNVRVMVLSRDENDIRASFDEALQVDVALGVVDDLQLFISNCINRIVEKQSWKGTYTAAMSSRVEGVNEKRFRWASLMQRKFSQCLDHETMQQALETLPESLEDMYADILTKQIPKDYREKARRMLTWLAYSMRPLRLQELATVADLPDDTDVLRICTSSLVTSSQEILCPRNRSVEATWSEKPKRESEEDIIVKFDHFSVKEYLISEELQASGGHSASYFFVPPLLAHLSIAEKSVSHLLKTNGSHFTEKDIYVDHTSTWEEYDCEDGWVEVSDTTKKLATDFWPEFPLLEYATFWHNHVLEADAIEARLAPIDATKPSPSELKADTQSTLSEAEKLRTQIHRLFSDAFSQSFRNWVFVLNLFVRGLNPYSHSFHYPNYSEVPSRMWMASFLNLPDVVRRLLQSEMETGGRTEFICFWERQPDCERTPIQIATRYGNLKVLKLLLEADMHMEQSEFTRLVPDITQNTSAVLNTLLEARPYLSITERIVEKVDYKRAQADTYKLVLDSPSRVNLTKTMFDTIVQKLPQDIDSYAVDAELVETIMRRGEDIGYGSGSITEPCAQSEECGRQLERGIDRSKPPSISQDILALMAANTHCGKDMLAIAFDNYKDVQVSQNLLASIVANRRDGETMLAFLLEHGRCVESGQDLLTTIVASEDGINVLPVVLKHCKGLYLSHDLLVAAAKNWRSDGADLLNLIIGYDDNIEFSEDVLKTAANNKSNGAALVSVILNHINEVGISEDILHTAAGNSLCGAAILSVILSRYEEIEISEDTLKTAARNECQGGNVFWTILSHNRNIVISTNVMGAMVERWNLDMDIMNMLMNHGSCEVNKCFKSREEMTKHRTNRGIHYHRCKFEVSRKMKEAAIRWEPDAIAFLEAHKRPNVTFTRSPPQETPEDANS